MEEVVEEKKNNGVGFIGAVLGGIIGALPWMGFYLFLNMISGLLAALIPIGALAGYRLLKGQYTRGLKKTIIILSFLIVSLVTFLVIPVYYSITLPIHLATFYQESWLELLYNWFMSILTSIIGLALSIASINKGLKRLRLKEEGENTEEKGESKENNYEISEKEQAKLNKFKQIFTEYQALDKKHGIEKEKIFEKLNGEEDEKEFKHLLRYEVIKKSKGKYYYAEKNEKNTSKEYMLAMIALIIVMVINSVNSSNNDDTKHHYSQQEKYHIESFEFGDNALLVQDIDHIKESEDSISDGFAFETDQLGYISVFYSTKEEVHDILKQLHLVENEDTENDLELYSQLVLLNLGQSYQLPENANMEPYSLLDRKGYHFSAIVDADGDEIAMNTYLIETDHYFIEAYGSSYKNKAAEDAKIFEQFLSHIEENNN